MLKWVKLGLGPVGSEGNKGMDMQQGVMKGGQASGLGHKRDESLKGKNKVNELGLVKSPKRVWKAKT